MGPQARPHDLLGLALAILRLDEQIVQVARVDRASDLRDAPACQAPSRDDPKRGIVAEPETLGGVDRCGGLEPEVCGDFRLPNTMLDPELDGALEGVVPQQFDFSSG